MKIAFIGGGSLLWGPRLITDVALTSEIYGGTIALQDIDAEALTRMQPFAQRICDEADSHITVEASQNRRAALMGADFVIFSVGVGGLEAFRVDLEVPARYGIVQPVGCNVGPGGFNRALRHIPVILSLCREMEQLCPEAWLLNLTNPLTQLTWAACRESSIRTIGLCHEITGVTDRLAEMFGVQAEDIWMRVAGINHLPWILEMRVKGRDGFEMLDEWLAEHGPLYFVQDELVNSPFSVFKDRMGVKLSMYQVFGVLPGAGDRHVVEFYPYFIREETNWGLDYGVELTTIEHRYRRNELRINDIKRYMVGEEPIPLVPSAEQVAPIISALSGGQPGRFIVNIPNQGQVPNLPEDAVIECFARIDQGGIYPDFVGPLPPGPQQICACHLTQQEVTIDAAISGDRRLALQALYMDPTIQNWATAPAMLDEMLRGTADHLPQFAD